MLLIQVIWILFDAETDVGHLSDVNYNSDTDHVQGDPSGKLRVKGTVHSVPDRVQRVNLN